MRIDKLINDMQPNRQVPKSLSEIYAKEDDPEDQYHKDLNDFYNPNKKYIPCD